MNFISFMLCNFFRPVYYPVLYQPEALYPKGGWSQSPAPPDPSTPWLHQGLLHPLPSSPSPPLLNYAEDICNYRYSYSSATTGTATNLQLHVQLQLCNYKYCY